MNDNDYRQWYYAENGRQIGPVPHEEFTRLVARGTVTAETLIWHGGMKEWQPYGIVAGGGVSGTGGTSCHYCGRPAAADDLIDFGGTSVCAACKPVFVQQFKENAELATPLSRRYAGFWIRGAALFLDGIIMNLIQYAIIIPLSITMAESVVRKDGPNLKLMAIAYIISFSVGILYYVIPLAKWGATPGKMACGLKVIRSDGSPITWGRAFGRYFGNMLSSMLLGIGYLMAAFDKGEHKALHDNICDTRVIYKNQ